MNQVQHPDPASTYGGAGTVGYLGPIKVSGASKSFVDDDKVKAIEKKPVLKTPAVDSGAGSVFVATFSYALVVAVVATMM